MSQFMGKCCTSHPYVLVGAVRIEHYPTGFTIFGMTYCDSCSSDLLRQLRLYNWNSKLNLYQVSHRFYR